jgi:ribosomal protein S18 acetylase RimI-like enzyme
LRDFKRKMLEHIAPEDIVKACEQNYIDYWACAGAPPWAEFLEDKGITRAITGLPNEIFNVVLKCRLGQDKVEETIDAAIEDFRSRRIPLLWHVGRLSEPADLGGRLEARGYPNDYDLRAMAVCLDVLKMPTAIPEKVRVDVVSDESQSVKWIECLASSWHVPKEVPEWMSRNPCFNVGVESRIGLALNRRMYLGLLDDEPVSASMLFWNEGIAGLQAVGTVPSAQNRGVGSATVRAALMDARSMDYSEVVVLSTVEGVKLYEKLGFRTFGNLPEHSMRFD